MIRMRSLGSFTPQRCKKIVAELLVVIDERHEAVISVKLPGEPEPCDTTGILLAVMYDNLKEISVGVDQPVDRFGFVYIVIPDVEPRCYLPLANEEFTGKLQPRDSSPQAQENGEFRCSHIQSRFFCAILL